MGRTLDYEFSYGDQITVTPRNYPFSFLHMPSLSHHYAMIGMACVMDDYPLYYEAFNEKGVLAIAGLNFCRKCRLFRSETGERQYRAVRADPVDSRYMCFACGSKRIPLPYQSHQHTF